MGDPKEDVIEKFRAGTGVAVFSSFFNHSCCPDVIGFSNDEGEVLFYATKPIKKGSQVKSIFINLFYDQKKIKLNKAKLYVCFL